MANIVVVRWALSTAVYLAGAIGVISDNWQQPTTTTPSNYHLVP